MQRRAGGEFANELLEDVLQCDQPLQFTVLINHQREALAMLLKILQLRQYRG